MKNKGALFIIFITIFVDLVGFGIILPILPFYAENFGANATQIGLLSASFSLMQFIFAPFWGRLSDRIGRRPIIIMSLFFSSISLVFFGSAQNLAMLFAARIFAGIFMANFSAAQAYIADITTPEDRAKGMGLVGAAFGLGFIFGPSIGGLLSSTPILSFLESAFTSITHIDMSGVLTAHPYRIPAYFAALLALLNTLGAFKYLPESRTKEDIAATLAEGKSSHSRFELMKKSLLTPIVGIFVVLYFLVTLAFANLEATFALFTEHVHHYTSTDNGYLFAYIGVVIAIVQGGLIGPLTHRFSEGSVLIAGVVIQGAAFFFLPYTSSLASLLLITGLISVGNGLTNPTLQSLISCNTDRTKQGGVLGITQSFGSLARVIGPAWGGFFFDQIGVAAPYWSGGILLLMCSWLAWFATQNMRNSGFKPCK
ncbi:MAG: MFS transporter [Deferribacteres bacterium]|nr:MFS transporter [candidate division KSB1 bacterium]MCB9501099.1 MFS transporter [Deferribacteres bacterium]